MPAPHPFETKSDWALAAFRLYLHWYFWRSFSGVRLALRNIPERHEGRPLVIYTNHPGWWDPALFIFASPKLFPGRIEFGPMEAAALEKYKLFKKFGVFGLPEGRAGAQTFLRVATTGLRNPRAIMWITAEGSFADARRRPVSLRPGIAHLARHMPDVVFLPCALEYVFWNESKPEALMAFGPPCTGGAGTTMEWTERLEAGLTSAMDGLAEDAMTRDPARFTTLLAGTAGVGLFYDAWRGARALVRGQSFSARHG